MGGSMHMEFSMTVQVTDDHLNKSDCLIEVTAWTGLTVYNLLRLKIIFYTLSSGTTNQIY